MDIRRVIARPAKKMIQPDGRIRLYGFVHSMSTYLRVVLLSDGETVHNAFPDEDFRGRRVEIYRRGNGLCVHVRAP
jgi:hypothetical protein